MKYRSYRLRLQPGLLSVRLFQFWSDGEKFTGELFGTGFLIINVLFKESRGKKIMRLTANSTQKESERKLWLTVTCWVRFISGDILFLQCVASHLELVARINGVQKWDLGTKSEWTFAWADRPTRRTKWKREDLEDEKPRADIFWTAEIKDRSLVKPLNITTCTGVHSTVKCQTFEIYFHIVCTYFTL